MFEEKDNVFMMQALAQARVAYAKDEVPIGAVIVSNGKVIAKGYNQVELLSDPTAHAEMLAITSATSVLGKKWLGGCTLYVTIEPCNMCAGALILSRIDRVVFGAFDEKTGAFGSTLDVNKIEYNHKIDVVSGVLKEECIEIIQRFFREKRKDQ